MVCHLLALALRVDFSLMLGRVPPLPTGWILRVVGLGAMAVAQRLHLIVTLSKE